MAEESRNFSAEDVMSQLLEQTKYAINMLHASREALFESKIGDDFNGKVPRPVIMHAISNALTECKMPGLDYDKFNRGVISLCLFFLEDEDVNIALKMREGLGGEDG
mgnify:CR=1 FL=1